MAEIDNFIAGIGQAGGQAFPSTMPTPEGGTYVSMGMTMRDWFAGQALSGMFRHEGWINTIDSDQDEVAKRSYAIADAMVAYRKAGAE